MWLVCFLQRRGACRIATQRPNGEKRDERVMQGEGSSSSTGVDRVRPRKHVLEWTYDAQNAGSRSSNSYGERRFSCSKRLENARSLLQRMHRTLVLHGFSTRSPWNLLSFAMLPPEQQTRATMSSSCTVCVHKQSTKAFLRRSQPRSAGVQKREHPEQCQRGVTPIGWFLRPKHTGLTRLNGEVSSVPLFVQP